MFREKAVELHLMVPVLICGFPGPLMALAPKTNVIYKLSLPATKQLIRPDLTSTQLFCSKEESIGLQDMNTRYCCCTDKGDFYQIWLESETRNTLLDFCTDNSNSFLVEHFQLETASLCSHSDNCRELETVLIAAQLKYTIIYNDI